MNLWLFCIFLFTFYTNGVATTCRLKEQVSIVLPKSRFQCFRILNGTHQVGCQSDKNGNIGTVVAFHPNFEETIAMFEKNYEPMIALIEFKALDRGITELLHSSPAVKGVLFFGEQSTFSEDAVCPTVEFSLYDKSTCQPWNKRNALHDAGFRFLDWNKPIFVIDDKKEQSLLMDDCYEKFNKHLVNASLFSTLGLRCRAKMSMFMRAAGNADMCLRRQSLYYGFTEILEMCEPLSSFNVHYTVPVLHAEDKANIFLMTARLDSFSTFSLSLGGDNSVLTSLIPILLVAKAIGTNREFFEKKAKENDRQVMFSFLNGESLGYIGSSRMAYDMLLHEFPRKPKNYGKLKTGPTIDFKDIGFFAEVNHIGAPQSKLFFHVDGQNFASFKQKIDPIANTVKEQLFGFNIKSDYANDSINSQLPPTSYQNFLRHNREIPGFVLSTDSSHFELDAINSITDIELTANKLGKDHLRNYFDAVAKSLLSAVTTFVYNDTNSATNDYVFDPSFAETLIDCFFEQKWNCSYFQRIVPNYDERFHSVRNFYIGTNSQDPTIVYLVEAILVQALGETHATMNVKAGDQCETLNPGQTVYNYIWAYNEAADKNWCYRTSMFRTKAKSPVFDDGFNNNMLNYSTWVESIWDAHKLEVYLEGAHYTTPHLLFSLFLFIFAVFLTLLDWNMVNGRMTQRVVDNGRHTAVRYQSIPTSAAPALNQEIVFENDLI
uniref:Nicastrin n=1 Tax=Panagrolaimus sp. JU765 TaxID=591449 RepID=A0AC34PV52_9BILA